MDNLLDMIFVMGYRGRNADTVFSQQKELVKSMIDKARHLNAAFGVVQYGNTGRRSIGMDPKSTKELLWLAIDELRPIIMGTKYELGVREALDMFTKEGRPNARRVIILLGSDGLAKDDGELKRIALLLSEENVEMFVVGYGSHTVSVSRNDHVHIVQPGEAVENTTDIVAKKPLTGLSFFLSDVCVLRFP